MSDSATGGSNRHKSGDKKAPVASFEFPVQGGRLQLAVWESNYGEGDKEKTTHNVTFKRSYFDQKTKKWGETQYLRLTDLPALASALQIAYGQIVLNHEQP